MGIYVAVYRLSVSVYVLGVRMAALFHPKAKLFIKGRQGIFNRMQEALRHEDKPRIWMHCASLGEFEQGRPVLERMKKEYPGFALILTFFSPSGYEIRKNYQGAHYIFYLPTDSKSNARQFLDIARPSLCVFVKYEFWYFYLSELKQRGIPALLISAIFRKEQVFFKWYGKLQRYMLRCFSHVFVQDKDSVTLLNSIGINEVSVSGDTRFDRVLEAAKDKAALPIASAFTKGHVVIIAGSTWKNDEVFLRNTFALLTADWRLIIVPHEVDAQHINEIEKLFPGASVKWSEWKEGANSRVLIVDRVGFLLQLYRYADAAWIGGAFDKAGVHNVLEAAVYGKPCAYGPIFHQFKEAGELISAGGAISTDKPASYAAQLKQWNDEPQRYDQACKAARDYVLRNAGATDIIMDHLVSMKSLMLEDAKKVG
jgi:3-deoxy-D-manno-octulosonic-acid transferase